MKKMLFIVNPRAGKQKATKVLGEILAIFNRAGFCVQVYITAGPKDATQAVKQFAPGMDLVVCSGGDGTFNETVTGMLDSGLRIPIGYIPAGSTNDFAHSLKIPTKPLEAANLIATGTPKPLDLGQFGDQYFSYVASFGAFTKVSYNTPQGIKNVLGHTAYLLEGVKELSNIHKIPVRIELDGETLEDDYIFGAICNSTSIGGILTFNPDQVDMADGLFEILLVRSPKNLLEITELVNAIRKQNYNCKLMTFRSSNKATVRIDKETDWTLDGEMAPGAEEVAVANLYHAIELIY